MGDSGKDSVSGRDLFRMSIELINRYNTVNGQSRDFGTGIPLSVSELHLVEAVGKNEPVSATRIASAMGVTKGAVSQMLPKLEQKGVVQRSSSPEDGRAMAISLTAVGRTVFDRHSAVHGQMLETFNAAADSMSAESRADAAKLIRAMSGFLGSLMDKEGNGR